MRNLKYRAYQKIKLLGIAIAALVGLTTASLANPIEIDRIKKIEPLLYDFIYKHTDYNKSLELPPATYVFKDQQELNTIYYGKPIEDGTGFQVQALYNGGVIFLKEGFNVKRDAFILLHELVHHIQFNHGAEFECVREMEREAYDVMDAYVKVSGNGELTDPMFKIFLTCRPEMEFR